MTPLLSIGSLVEVIGPSISGQTGDIGHKFRITQENKGVFYTNGQEYNYPASSLRLVEEGLKIGDWVRVVNEKSDLDGSIFQIDEITEMLGTLVSGFGKPWFLPRNLRKLTPEEIQQYQDRPDIRTAHANDIVAYIHDRPSTERLSDIEKRHQEIERGQNNLTHQLNAHTIKLRDMQKSIDVLMGEMPEACESPLTKMGTLAAMAGICEFPAALMAPFQRFESDMAKVQQTVGCKPNAKQIHISIQRGNDWQMIYPKTCCPAEALEWCKRVLDSIREG
jgi:hypothetical protein